LIDFIHEVDGSGGQFFYMPGGGSLNPDEQGNDREAHALRPSGWAAGIQVCRPEADGAMHEVAGAQWAEGIRY
jgi:hypothetical protein